MIRKVQEKKEREGLAANLSDEREGEVQERGVVETMDEKQIANREVKEEEKAENVKVSTKSIESMSL